MKKLIIIALIIVGFLLLKEVANDFHDYIYRIDDLNKARFVQVD